MNYKLLNFLNKKYTYAIVGASNNEEKYGYTIFKSLLDAGFRVIPINPKEDLVLGQKCFHNLSQFQGHIDVVDFVVPAGVTIRVLEEVVDLEIKKVWFQPGSNDLKCEKFCFKNNIKYLSNFCLMKQALENF